MTEITYCAISLNNFICMHKSRKNPCFENSPGKIVPRLRLGVTISPVLSTRKTFAALSSWRMAPNSLDEGGEPSLLGGL